MRIRALVVAIGMIAASYAVAVGPAHAASTAYEAEKATVFHGTVDSDHTGFTGTGFVNTANEVGSYVQFTVNAPTAGAATLALRYANGTATGRKGSVSVNGAAVSTPEFAPTANWDSWAAARVPVTLKAGTNQVRVVTTTTGGLPNLDSLTVSDAQSTDWSDAMIDSTMQRYTPSSVGGWSYPVALYMMGQYQVAQRTTDPARRAALIAYVKAWADRFVNTSGHIDNSFDTLDSMMPGQVMIAMYRETGQAKYRLAAQQIHDRLLPSGGYPTTSDGGFWHGDSADRTDQLWSDGAFMADPFMAQYAKYIGDSTQSFDIATKQLVIYASHLQQPNGLLKHAYDASRSASWADPNDRAGARVLVPRHRLGRRRRHGDAGPDTGRSSTTGSTGLDRTELGPWHGRLPGPVHRTLVPGRGQGQQRRQLDRDVMLGDVHPDGRRGDQGRIRLTRRLPADGGFREARRTEPDLVAHRRADVPHVDLRRNERRRLRVLHQPAPGHERLPRTGRFPLLLRAGLPLNPGSCAPQHHPRAEQLGHRVGHGFVGEIAIQVEGGGYMGSSLPP